MNPIIFHKDVRGGVPFLTVKVGTYDLPSDEFEATEMAHQYFRKLRRMYRVIYGVGINANIETEAYRVLHTQAVHFVAYLGGR